MTSFIFENILSIQTGVLGINSHSDESDLLIYPNLINSGDEVTLKLDYNVAKLTFRIRDINGKVLQENELQDLARGQYTITLSSFSAGIYLYELALEGKVYSGKLIIR